MALAASEHQWEEICLHIFGSTIVKALTGVWSIATVSLLSSDISTALSHSAKSLDLVN